MDDVDAEGGSLTAPLADEGAAGLPEQPIPDQLFRRDPVVPCQVW